MRKAKRNFFYKLWLFLEIMTLKRILLKGGDIDYGSIENRKDNYVNELRNIS